MADLATSVIEGIKEVGIKMFEIPLELYTNIPHWIKIAIIIPLTLFSIAFLVWALRNNKAWDSVN